MTGADVSTIPMRTACTDPALVYDRDFVSGCRKVMSARDSDDPATRDEDGFRHARRCRCEMDRLGRERGLYRRKRRLRQ